MSRSVTGRRSVRGVGGALAAAGLAVAMLTGASVTASAVAVPSLTLYEEYGLMPDGSRIQDFRVLDRSTVGKYSANGRQWAEIARDVTWSEQAKAVRVRIQPRAFQSKFGLFWWNNTARVAASTTAVLTGPGGYSKTVRNFQVTYGTSGAWMHEYVPFGDAGKGTYCIQTAATVQGIAGASQTLANSRSTCFKR